jgi:hypothetical protein
MLKISEHHQQWGQKANSYSVSQRTWKGNKDIIFSTVWSNNIQQTHHSNIRCLQNTPLKIPSD